MMSTACNNSVFKWIYFVSDAENIILIIFNALLIPLTTVANALVIYSLIKTKQLNLGVNKMFCLLSISDFCIAVICEVAFMVLLTAYRQKRSCMLEFSIQYSSTFFCNFSGMIILSVAIDRYSQTRKTLKMVFDRNSRRTIYFMMCSVAVATAVTALDVLGTFMSKYSWINMSIQLGELTALTIIFTLYIMSYCSVSMYRRRNNKVLQTQGLPKHRQPHLKYARAMVVTIIMILASLVLCYSPLLVIGLHTVLQATAEGEAIPRRTFKNYLSFQFGFTSSFLSSVVFLHRNKMCRDYILNLWKQISGTQKLGNKIDSILNRNSRPNIVDIKMHSVIMNRSIQAKDI